MRLPTLFAALVVSWLGPTALGGQSSTPRQEVDDALQKMKFTAAEIATLHNGTVIARADTSGDGEILTQAAVKILVPHDQVVSYYGQMIAYVDGEVTLGFGRFSTPAAPADVAQLAFDRDEVDALKNCRPGRCDIRLGGAAFTTMQSAINWNAADYPAEVNGFARKAAIDYFNAYRARGDDALITYDDRNKPVSLRKEWAGILANASVFHAFHPALARYLAVYPKEPLPGARDILYWIKENYGLKPVISIVHGVVYTPAGQTDRTIVAQKYIYASHYYDASLALGAILSGTENGSPATYIVYGNRSRGDLLRGGFSGIQRSAARSQARKAAEQTLSTIKSVLEKRG
jgi:hypothetical protein